MKMYRFIRTGRDWYIDLPEFIEQGGSMGDLQMVEGADKMLDMIAGDKDSVSLTISKDPFEGSNILTLTEKCDPYIGGGYYRMEEFEGTQVNKTMWCQVTEFVFNDIPPLIYIRREKQ